MGHGGRRRSGADRPGRRGVPDAGRGARARARHRPAVVVASRRSPPTRSSRTTPSCSRPSSRPAYRGEIERRGRRRASGWARRRLARRRSPPRATARRSASSRCCKDADVAAAPRRGRHRARRGRRRPRVDRLPRAPASRSDLLRTVAAHRDRPHRHPRRRQQGPSKRMPSRRRNAVDPLQLQPGDLVVHEQHGVGALRRDGAAHRAGRDPRVPHPRVRPERGHRRPRLRPDRPARARHPLRRRRGAVARPARRRRLGQAQGPRARRRSRRSPPASSSSTARAWPRRATPSARTPRGSASSRTPSRTSRRPTSSRRSTRSRRDMEKPVPMDRVICGDVGYGKTEIAVRAAFKAVQDGKQVAVLVPTTLLVQQHYNTFRDRFAQFPVTVRAVSRFNSDKEQKEVMDGVTRRHRRRRHRHAPAAVARRRSSRTSAWSSSTRSSASASSTRSSSSRCAPRWTC